MTKGNALVLGLVAATVAAVVAYPAMRGNAAGGGQTEPVAAAMAPRAAASVEVVFVLDTTGSMGGLIAAAKEKIWSIATTLAQADPAPAIKIGLVTYRDRGDDYVTRVFDLSRDLDSLYAQLMQFRADGGGDGPEDVNQALSDAIERMSWSADQNVYKAVFLVGDAPPHMDYPGAARYPEIVAAAARKGIVVNTIQCGQMADTVAPWRQIAALGGGRYFTVEQSGGAIAIASPYDREIARLAAALDATRLYYGTAAERGAMEEKVAATDSITAAASAAALARRGVFNVSASGAANLAGEHELVQDVASGRVELDAVPQAQLPASLAELSAEERKAHVAELAKRREELQQRIAELGRERDAFLADEIAERGGAAESLDVQLYDAVREQAAPKGLRYDSGPKY